MAITERVKALPKMNFRPKEERDQIEEARHDPDEAREDMTKHMKERALIFKQNKADMMERVKAIPKMSIRPKEERERIEELRHDPDEALEDFTKHMKKLKDSWKEEKAVMSERVKAIPKMSFRPRQERDQIEELRQDPDEAREKMTRHMRNLAQSYRDSKEQIDARVQAQPKKTFRTKEERDRMEELRQDPEEAREKAIQDMKERARSYRAEMGAMTERVKSMPRKTFRSKVERERLEEIHRPLTDRTIR